MREKYLKFIEEYLKEIRIFDLMNKRLIIFLKSTNERRGSSVR
jgi:hypothetical protein